MEPIEKHSILFRDVSYLALVSSLVFIVFLVYDELIRNLLDYDLTSLAFLLLILVPVLLNLYYSFKLIWRKKQNKHALFAQMIYLFLPAFYPMCIYWVRLFALDQSGFAGLDSLYAVLPSVVIYLVFTGLGLGLARTGLMKLNEQINLKPFIYALVMIIVHIILAELVVGYGGALLRLSFLPFIAEIVVGLSLIYFLSKESLSVAK